MHFSKFSVSEWKSYISAQRNNPGSGFYKMSTEEYIRTYGRGEEADRCRAIIEKNYAKYWPDYVDPDELVFNEETLMLEKRSA